MGIEVWWVWLADDVMFSQVKHIEATQHREISSSSTVASLSLALLAICFISESTNFVRLYG